MALPITITNIDQLPHITDKGLPTTFNHNYDCIFNSNHEIVTKILDDRTTSVLNDIKQLQLIKFAELCPEFSVELAIPRTVVGKNKQSFVQDILLLGNSIIAKSPVNKVKELVYNFPKEADNFDLSNQAGMKKCVNLFVENRRRTKM